MLPKGQDFFTPGELLFLATAAGNAIALVAAIAIASATSSPSAAVRPPRWWPSAGERCSGRGSAEAALRSRRGQALAIVRAFAIAGAAYFLLVLATTVRPPAPIPSPRIGDAVCRAHRCLAVVTVDRAALAGPASVAVTLRLSNSSRYPSHDQWPRGVFVVDDRGGRHPLDGTEAPLTAPLDAGEVRTTIRRFTLPAAARPVGLFVEQTDGPGYAPWLRCLIVGGSCWYAPPPHPPIVFD